MTTCFEWRNCGLGGPCEWTWPALAGFPSPTSNGTKYLSARGPFSLESHRTNFLSLLSSLGDTPESCRES